MVFDGKTEVLLEVTGFRGQQAGIKPPQFFIESRCERREAFRGTRLDERARDQHIDQRAGLGFPDQLAQTRGVTRGGQWPVGRASFFHQRAHLLKMPELLAGQSGHPVDQFLVARVTEHQAQRRRRRLQFTTGVIEQQDLRLSQRLRHPFGRRRVAEKRFEFLRQVDGCVAHRCGHWLSR